jgi:curved DNA-binding protein CbpA
MAGPIARRADVTDPMAPETDPYAVLGLARGASLGDVKRAYRRLAKINHPDAAGERNVARFLAIQRAYEQLAEGLDPSGSARRPTGPRRPWEADPDRAASTRRAYGSRGRRSSRGSPSGTADRAGSRGPEGGTSGRAYGPRPPGGTAGAEQDSTSERGGSQPKATPGSTSYDGVDATPFEPDWRGASWYGTTSGTYWTLNPKEYADPRKHGPEYQARARRAARDRRSASVGTTGGADEPDPSVDASHTTSSWWESTAGPGPTTTGSVTDGPGPAASTEPTKPSPPGAGQTTAGSVPPPDLAGALADLGRALSDERLGGVRGRLVRGLIGWLPLALGIGWLAGEISGCGRFAASCDGAAGPLTVGAQLLALAVLLAVPVAGSIATMASLTVLAVAIIAAVILSASGGAPDDARRVTLGSILLVAWVIGAAIAVVQRVRPRSAPAGPVS